MVGIHDARDLCGRGERGDSNELGPCRGRERLVWRGRRWFVVIVAYVGVHVYVRTPHCKLPQQRGAISDLGGDRTEGVLVR